jgi:hypothetical protein
MPFDPSWVCPPDAYQHEPNAPAHRHDERCRRADGARIAVLERANANLAAGLRHMLAFHQCEQAECAIVADVKALLANAEEATA